MKNFCENQMIICSKRYNASIKIQRIFRKWNRSIERRKIKENIYSIQTMNFFEEGIILAPSDGITVGTALIESPKPFYCFSLITDGRTYDFELINTTDFVVGEYGEGRDKIVEYLRGCML